MLEELKSDVEGNAFELKRKFREVPLESIVGFPYNPRSHFDEDKLRELADNIRQVGVAEPIILRTRNNCTDRLFYEGVAGERRFRPAGLAGLTCIPAMVYADMPKAVAAELAAVENLQRENMNAIEEATAYRQMMDFGNLNQTQVAERVSKPRSTVANALRLLELPELVQEHIRSGKLTPAHGMGLLRFKQWPKIVAAIAKIVVKRNVPASTLETGFPCSWQLEEEGLIVNCCNLFGPQWGRQAKKHPNKFFSYKEYGEMHYYCFDVAFARDFFAEWEKKRQASMQATIAKKAEGGMPEVIDFSKLSYGQRLDYTRVDSPRFKRFKKYIEPEEILRAKDEFGQFDVVPRKLFKALEAKETREVRKRLRAETEEKLKLVRVNWGLHTAESSLACKHNVMLLALVVLEDWRFRKYIGRALEALHIVIPPIFDEHGGVKKKSKVIEALSGLNADTIAQLVNYILLLHNVDEAIVAKSEASSLDYYVAQLPKEEKGRPSLLKATLKHSHGGSDDNK